MPDEQKQHSTLLEDARERHFGQEPSHRDVPPNWCPICGVFEQFDAAVLRRLAPELALLVADMAEWCAGNSSRHHPWISEWLSRVAALEKALK